MCPGGAMVSASSRRRVGAWASWKTCRLLAGQLAGWTPGRLIGGVAWAVRPWPPKPGAPAPWQAMLSTVDAVPCLMCRETYNPEEVWDPLNLTRWDE